MPTSLKFLAAGVALAAALQAVPALADDAPAATPPVTISGNVALVTDYRFRGVSQSAGDPAIQGGITLSTQPGFYISTWSSSIHGGEVLGDQELDLIAGWTGPIGEGLTADAGLLYYVYPGGHVGKANFFEPYATISGQFGPIKPKVGINYAWKQDAIGEHSNLYFLGNVDVGVPNTPLTVSAHVGYTDGKLAPAYLAGEDKKHGWDWSIGASVVVLSKLTLGVSYVDTQGPSINDFTDGAVVGSISVAF